MHRRTALALHVAAHAASLLPLALLAWDYAGGHLTANPIREVQLRTGRYAVTLLALSLACSPVNALTGYREVMPLRRILGLYAFAWVCLHFLNFLVVDYGLDFTLIGEDIFEKRYAIAGFAAFLCLLPAAATSTEGWARRLGPKWHRLHQAVYLGALLAMLHFTWAAKADSGPPVVFAVAIGALLLLRLPPVRRWVGRRRR